MAVLHVQTLKQMFSALSCRKERLMVGVLQGPQIPNPQIGSGSDSTLGADLGSGGGVPIK